MAQFNADILLRLKTEALDRKLKRIENKIGNIAAKGGDTKKLERRYDIINNKLDGATKRVKKRNLAEQTNTRELKAQTAELTKQNKARRGRLQGAALGAGFPLLFGGGAGSVLGGVAGSAGGFGGQILGSALGQAADTYIQSLTKLAQSLKSTNGILEGLENAGYKVSASTESVIESYQRAGLEAEAYELAIAEINKVLGPNGAAILSDYRIETENLSQEIQNAKAALDAELIPALTGTIRIILGLKDAFDTLAESPLFKLLGTIGKNVAFVNPGIALSKGFFDNAQRQGATDGTVVTPDAQKRAEEEVKLKKLTEQTEELLKQADAENKKSDAARAAAFVLDAQIKAAEAGTDLAKDSVYQARQEVIERKFINDTIKAGTNEAEKQLAVQQRKLALLNLESSRTAALTRGSRSGGSAPRSKALQLEQQILREQEKQEKVALRATGVVKGRLYATQLELQQLQDRYRVGLQLIDIQEEEALKNNKVAADTQLIKNLAEERRQTLDATLGLRKLELEALEAQLILERALTKERAARETRDIGTGITRNIEDIEARIANPFGGDQAERAQLLVEQTRRYEDVMQKLNDQIADNNKIIAESKDLDQVQLAIDNNEELQKRIGLYQKLLPQLDEVEQRELALQQMLQKYSGVTSALASGISSVMSSAVEDLVNGTATVEEAFANMFKSIGKAFLDMVAQILAQKAVLAILGAFGGGSNSGSGVGSFFPLGKGFAFAEGGRPPVGQYSVVGENGPELVKFDNAATVYSNPDSRAMLSQYSPGGGMSGGGTIRFESTVINGVEYVTREEAEAIGNRAAQAGARGGHVKSMRTLQNSRSQRAKLGMR